MPPPFTSLIRHSSHKSHNSSTAVALRPKASRVQVYVLLEWSCSLAPPFSRGPPSIIPADFAAVPSNSSVVPISAVGPPTPHFPTLLTPLRRHIFLNPERSDRNRHG